MNDERMTAAQRRVTLAISVNVGLTLLVVTGLTFLVVPMAEDLGLSDAAVEDILVVPALAALIVVFVAGRAGDRFGQRRTMLAAAFGFTAGSLVVAGAPGELAADIGLALCGAGAIVMQVVGVSLLQQTAREGHAHVSAFTTYGMVFPIAFLVLPIVTAGALGLVGWRWIPLGWAMAGILMAFVAWALLDRQQVARATGEWMTPLLAGVSLAAGSLAIAEIDNVLIEPLRILVGAVIAVVAAVGCMAIMRMSPRPSFSLAPVRGRVMHALLLGVALLSLLQMLTYICIFLEFFYGMSAFEVSLIVAPAQIGAVLGAKVLAQRTVRRWGVTRAGQALMLATGISMLPLALMQVTSPAWYLIACATLFSFTGMGALTVLNMDVMGRAPENATGAVSALRTAASTIGTAFGMALLGTILISSVEIGAGVGDVDIAQLERLVFALRIDGVLAFVIAVIGWIVLRAAGYRSGSRVDLVGGA